MISQLTLAWQQEICWQNWVECLGLAFDPIEAPTSDVVRYRAEVYVPPELAVQSWDASTGPPMEGTITNGQS